MELEVHVKSPLNVDDQIISQEAPESNLILLAESLRFCF